MKPNNDRRDFLRKCALFSATGLASSYTTLGALSGPVLAATRPTGYRAMVCIYLEGGNDGNILLNNSDDHFQAYQSQRGNRALAREDLLTIQSGTEQYGLHPAMTEVRDLYQQKKVAFIANVGSLKEPTTVQSYIARSVKLPPKLFSHISQKDFIRSGLPFEGEQRTGWAGRIADLYNDTWTAQVPMNMSTADTSNVWQQGLQTNPYGFGGVVHVVFGYQQGVGLEGRRRAAIEQLYGHDYQHPLINTFGNINSMYP